MILKVFILKIDLFFFLMKKQELFDVLKFIFLRVEGREVSSVFAGDFPSSGEGDDGTFHLRHTFCEEVNPALTLFNQEENPPKQDCVSTPYIPPASQPNTGQSLARSKLAGSRKSPWLQKIPSGTRESLPKYRKRVLSPVMYAKKENCFGGLQLFLSTGI